MTIQQARACVYLAAASTALAFGCLVLLIVLAIQKESYRSEVEFLTHWSIAIYEKLDASECVSTAIPKVPLKEE